MSQPIRHTVERTIEIHVSECLEDAINAHGAENLARLLCDFLGGLDARRYGALAKQLSKFITDNPPEQPNPTQSNECPAIHHDQQ